jgi:hypothetical protein
MSWWRSIVTWQKEVRERIFSSFFIILLFGGTLWHLKISHNIAVLNSPPWSFYFKPLPAVVSTALTFPFSYFHHMHPYVLSSPTGTNPRHDLFCPPALHFGKKRQFCLIKTAIQGVSLWQFHVNMYHKPNWFIPSNIFLSTLVSFLWWFQQV